jgi:predicted nucleic acid-binding protein
MTHLLDSSVAIALVADNHTHHDVAERWLTEAGPVALCPITEGAVVRFLVRQGVPAALARARLRDIHRLPGWSFTPDSLSYADADLDAVAGYRQVTDAYLVCLARAIGARLATLDQALAAAHPEVAVEIGRESPARPPAEA